MTVNSVVRPSLLFLIPTLGHGGAQKILVELVRHLTPEYKVTVLTLRENSNDVYSVKGHADLISVDLIRGNKVALSTLLKAPIRLRNEIKNLDPDIVISFQDIANFSVLIGTIGLKNLGLIVSERQDTRFYSLAFLRKLVRAALYSRADSIVVQTRLIEKQFPGWLHNKMAIIPNQIVPFGVANPVVPDKDGVFRVVAAGRYEKQKDFEILIDAASYLKEHFGNWRIDIYGQGSLRQALIQKVESYGLDEFVSLNEPHQNLGDVLKSSNLFVLPSVYEGFPNVLAEAVSCGLPVIAFSGVSGTSELIDDGENGFLVDERSPVALSESMKELMTDESLRESFGKYSSSVAPRFKPEVVFQNWIDLIKMCRKH